MKQLSTAHAVLIAGLLCAGAIVYHASRQAQYQIGADLSTGSVVRLDVRTGAALACIPAGTLDDSQPRFLSICADKPGAVLRP